MGIMAIFGTRLFKRFPKRRGINAGYIASEMDKKVHLVCCLECAEASKESTLGRIWRQRAYPRKTTG